MAKPNRLVKAYIDPITGDLFGDSGKGLTASGSIPNAGGSAGVSALNSLTGGISLVGQGNVDVNAVGQNIVISGTATGGGSDHASLSNLDFASAGHTGFTSSTEFVNASGSLQSSIDAIDSSVTLQEAYDNGTGVIATTGGKPFQITGDDVLFKNEANAQLEVVIDSGDSSTSVGAIIFKDQGSTKWQLYKSTVNRFALYDMVEGNNVLEIFSHAGNANALTVRNGRVGIGIQNPTEKLHVVGSGIITGDLEVQNNLEVQGNAINFKNSEDTQLNLYIDSGSSTATVGAIIFRDQGFTKWQLYKSTTNRFALYDTVNGNNAFTVYPHVGNNEALVINTGRVGIGTASPSEKLHVVGSGIITGTLTANTLATASTTVRSLSDRAADVFNVKDYGALGDGATADVVAIQAAIDAAESAGGGIVYFPAGTYRTAVPLIVDSDFVTILGSGVGSTIIRAASAMTILLRMGPADLSLTSLEYCQVLNITLNGNSTCTDAVLRGYNNHFCLYENLRIISGSSHGGFFDGDITELSTKNHVNIYRGIWALSNGGEGLHWEGDKSSMYSDLFANNNGSHGIVWEASNLDEPSTLSELTEVTASNIIAATNTGDGIVWDGVAKFSAANFLAHNNGGAGLRFRSTHNIVGDLFAGANIGSSIANLVLRNNEAGGIVTDTNTFVTGCQFGEVQVIGSKTATDLVGINMRGWTNCSFGSIYAASISGTGILMQDGTGPNGEAINCSHNSISRINLNSNGMGTTLKHGIRIIEDTNSIHIGSIYSTSNDDSGAGYELSIEGAARDIHISNYELRPSSAQQIQLTTSNITRVYFNGPNIAIPIPTVVASGTITIPPCEQLVDITGSTTISSITDSWKGRTITLAFDESLSFTEGGGMFMAGTFSPTANSTMTFVCNGTQWHETSRMLN